MSHFVMLMDFKGPRVPDGRSALFSMPSELRPHRVPQAKVRVRRCFVDMIGLGEVISSGHDTLVNEPSGATLIVPVSGRITSTTADDVSHRAEPGAALFFSPNRRRTRVEPAGAPRFVGIPVVIPRAQLRAAAARLDARASTLRKLDDFALALWASRSAEAAELIALVRELHAEAAAGRPALLRAEAHRSWTDLLSQKMVEVLHAAGLTGLPDPVDAKAARRHLRTARDFMDAHYADIVTMADVAQACGTGVRTLEVAFRTLSGQTPVQALQEVRLGAARRALLSARPTASVTEIALQVGFGHLGRFSVGYRERFGETPSETLRRVRARFSH